MAWAHIALLGMAGGAAGFVAGLIGLGGGIVFTPVLLLFYTQTGIDAVLAPKLTIGTSLLCTLIAALASARYQLRAGAVQRRVALWVGGSSAVAVFLMTLLVTTRPWYDATVFQLVFGTLLLVVVGRMMWRSAPSSDEGDAADPDARSASWSLPGLFGTGSVAGAVSSAAGVGGGVVLVPAYNRLMRLPIHQSVGTSSATIVLISCAGIASYALLGWGDDVPATAVGYVDVGRALLLALPAVFSARLGVWAAHKVARRPLQLIFAVVAAFVALRMLYGAVPGL